STVAFTFDHAYTVTGQFTVTVRVTNTINGTSGTGGFQITVSGNGQIFLGLPNSLSLTTNMTPWGCGSFFDTNATNGSWSGTVNYGDGSGNQQLFLTIPPSGSCAQSGTN